MDPVPIAGTGAELRQAQLLEVAKEIILSEGVEALRHATVADRAGVTRAVIYRYFPKQSDFFLAISNEFIEALKQRLSIDKQIEAVRSSVGGNQAAANHYFDVVFSVLEEKGAASLMLLMEPDLNPRLKSLWGEFRENEYAEWLHRSAGINLAPIDREVLIQVGKMTTLTLYKHYRAGDLSRNQAVSKTSHIVCELINILIAKN